MLLRLKGEGVSEGERMFHFEMHDERATIDELIPSINNVCSLHIEPVSESSLWLKTCKSQ